MPRTRLVRALAALAGAALLLGCTGAVEVADAPGASDPACAQVAAAYPLTVAGHERRETSGGTRGVAAAWGDPAVVARCGVTPLAPTPEPCIEVDGVGWISADLTDGVRLTTFGTTPALEVLVPSTYGAAPLLLPAFTKAAKALPGNGLRCR